MATGFRSSRLSSKAGILIERRQKAGRQPSQAHSPCFTVASIILSPRSSLPCSIFHRGPPIFYNIGWHLRRVVCKVQTACDCRCAARVSQIRYGEIVVASSSGPYNFQRDAPRAFSKIVIKAIGTSVMLLREILTFASCRRDIRESVTNGKPDIVKHYAFTRY